MKFAAAFVAAGRIGKASWRCIGLTESARRLGRRREVLCIVFAEEVGGLVVVVVVVVAAAAAAVVAVAVPRARRAKVESSLLAVD
jgi:hypothetical protein